MEAHSASSLELVELLTEYTDKLHRYIEYETDRKRRRTSAFWGVLAGVVAGTATGVPLILYLETLGTFEAAFDAALPLIVVLTVLLLVSLVLTTYLLADRYRPWRASSQVPHEVLTIAKILERIVARSVQMADHNRGGMDLKFDIKIAEAQAVLARFSALASRSR